MHRILLASLVALMAAMLPQTALAFESQGVVKSFNKKKMTFVLSDGERYTLPLGFQNPGIRKGSNVTVFWINEGRKTREVSSVVVNR